MLVIIRFRCKFNQKNPSFVHFDSFFIPSTLNAPQRPTPLGVEGVEFFCVFIDVCTPAHVREVEKMSYLKKRKLPKKESLGNGVRSQDSSELLLIKIRLFSSLRHKRNNPQHLRLAPSPL